MHANSYGSVVLEATATGLPIVVGKQGGYVDDFRVHEDALLFDTTDEAVDAVVALRDDPGIGSPRRRRDVTDGERSDAVCYSMTWRTMSLRPAAPSTR